MLEIAPASNESSIDREEDGVADTFDFVQSLKLYIAAEVNDERRQENLGGLDSNGIIWRGNHKQLTMKQNGMDIKPYVEAPSGFQLLAYATGTPPPDKVIFSGKVTYRINTQGS